MLRGYRLPFLMAALLCLGGAMCGFAYYKLATPEYSAHIVIAPPPDADTNQPMRVNLDILGGLAGASGSTSQLHQQFLFQLKSYDTAAVLLRAPKMRAYLDRYRVTRPHPTVDGVQGFVTSRLSLDQPRTGLVDKSPFTTLTFKDQDPRFAQYALSLLIDTSDRLTRERRMAELTARRAEILRTLPGVTTAEYREALVRLLAQVERERIFGSVTANYGFRTMDPIMVSSNPTDPRLLRSVGLGLFAGIMLGVIALVIAFFRVEIVSPRND